MSVSGSGAGCLHTHGIPVRGEPLFPRRPARFTRLLPPTELLPAPFSRRMFNLQGGSYQPAAGSTQPSGPKINFRLSYIGIRYGIVLVIQVGHEGSADPDFRATLGSHRSRDSIRLHPDFRCCSST